MTRRPSRSSKRHMVSPRSLPSSRWAIVRLVDREGRDDPSAIAHPHRTVWRTWETLGSVGTIAVIGELVSAPPRTIDGDARTSPADAPHAMTAAIRIITIAQRVAASAAGDCQTLPAPFR